MVEVSRKDLNEAKKRYRLYHHRYKEFDHGFSQFNTLIGLSPEASTELNFGRGASLEVSERGASMIRAILQSAPENTWVMLKVASIKHPKDGSNTAPAMTGTFTWEAPETS